MHIDILTLFPGMFDGPLTESILARAQEQELLKIQCHDLRQWGLGKHRQVDDSPYGGGAGMVMKADVIVSGIESLSPSVPLPRRGRGKRAPRLCSGQAPRAGGEGKPHRIYLSPRGKRLTQARVEQLAKKPWLMLLCGHYEGIDQRVVDGGWIDEEISIGDYILTGGEIPAMVLIDAVARQIPGVLGKETSAVEESFSAALGRKREYPHYTRPEEFRGLKVPDVLRDGNHAKIEKWRKEQTK